MTINKSVIISQLTPIAGIIKRYRVTLFLVSFLAIYGFLVIRINHLVQNEPTMTQLDQEKDSVKRLQLDQDTIDKLLELEAQNIEVQALFKDARENPFTE